MEPQHVQAKGAVPERPELPERPERPRQRSGPKRVEAEKLRILFQAELGTWNFNVKLDSTYGGCFDRREYINKSENVWRISMYSLGNSGMRDHKFLVFLFLMGWLMIIYAKNACFVDFDSTPRYNKMLTDDSCIPISQYNIY